MSLLKTSLLNGIAVCVRMGTGLVLNKIFAIHLGPGGFAAIGQLQNFIAMVTTFAAGAVNTGVTKYTAEYYDEPDRKNLLFRTAGTLTVIGSTVAGVLLIVLNTQVNRWLFGDQDYRQALVWLAVCLILISLNALLLAVLAGQKEVRRYVSANIASSLLGLAVSGTLAWFMGLQGALIALSLGQALSLLTTLYFCRGLNWCRVPAFWGEVDRATVSLLGRFVAMALATALAAPLTQMLIRSDMMATFGVAHAGYWDAMNKISAIYLALITTTLSLYYLPRISEIRDDDLLRKEISSAFKLILPATATFAAAIYLLREPLVRILFSPDFHDVTQLFGWQMVGDVVKIASWLLGYVLVGKAMMKMFIITEVVFSITLYFLTIYATREFGFKGAAMAYAFNYLLHLMTMYFVVVEWRLKRRRT
jgi:PST family polysaccharide transporter